MYTKIIKSNRNIICKKEGICLACKEYCELTDEHIIPQVIGGRLEWPGLDYTFDPSISKEVPVRSNFRAPYIKVNDILHPKQSKEFVRKEIRCGFKVFEKYTTDFEFLGIDL